MLFRIPINSKAPLALVIACLAAAGCAPFLDGRAAPAAAHAGEEAPPPLPSGAKRCPLTAPSDPAELPYIAAQALGTAPNFDQVSELVIECEDGYYIRACTDQRVAVRAVNGTLESPVLEISRTPDGTHSQWRLSLRPNPRFVPSFVDLIMTCAPAAVGEMAEPAPSGIRDHIQQ